MTTTNPSLATLQAQEATLRGAIRTATATANAIAGPSFGDEVLACREALSAAAERLANARSLLLLSLGQTIEYGTSGEHSPSTDDVLVALAPAPVTSEPSNAPASPANERETVEPTQKPTLTVSDPSKPSSPRKSRRGKTSSAPSLPLEPATVAAPSTNGERIPQGWYVAPG